MLSRIQRDDVRFGAPQQDFHSAFVLSASSTFVPIFPQVPLPNNPTSKSTAHKSEPEILFELNKRHAVQPRNMPSLLFTTALLPNIFSIALLLAHTRRIVASNLLVLVCKPHRIHANYFQRDRMPLFN